MPRIWRPTGNTQGYNNLQLRRDVNLSSKATCPSRPKSYAIRTQHSVCGWWEHRISDNKSTRSVTSDTTTTRQRHKVVKMNCLQFNSYTCVKSVAVELSLMFAAHPRGPFHVHICNILLNVVVSFVGERHALFLILKVGQSPPRWRVQRQWHMEARLVGWLPLPSRAPFYICVIVWQGTGAGGCCSFTNAHIHKIMFIRALILEI